MEKNKVANKVIYCYVVGDIFHIGHLIHLEKAKEQGNYLIVGVLTDEATMEKKPRPIIPFEERLRTFKALRVVDEVVPQYTYSPLGNVEKIKPDVLMESDSHDPDAIKFMKQFVEAYGGKVVVTEYYSPQSSSLIKTKIKYNWKKENAKRNI